MPPFERGEGGLAPLLDLPQLPTVLDVEADLYPHVVFDTSHDDATFVALAFERALHNVPENVSTLTEAMQEEVLECVDASIAAHKERVLQAMLANPTPQVRDRVEDGVDPNFTAPQYCIPGFMEAAEEVVPETLKEKRIRLRHEASAAEVPRPLSPACFEVILLGLIEEVRHGDRMAQSPDELRASQTEAWHIYNQMIAQAIELPAGNDLILRIELPPAA